jgi:hypothetical protein
VRAPLQQAVEHDSAGRLGEGGEFTERVLGVLESLAGVDADQDDILETQLTVLDLGDILEFGREAPDSAQRGASIPVELVAVGIRDTDGIDAAIESLGLERLRTVEAEPGHPGGLRTLAGEHAVEHLIVIGAHVRLTLVPGFR